METAGYLAAILIGISLGSMGGGGAILTVPVFVYLLQVNPVLATTYSMFVVGSCSLVGCIRAFLKGLVDVPVILNFSASSLLTVFLTRHFLVPAIPETILQFGGIEVRRDVLLMFLFSLLMLVVAFFIICRRDKTAGNLMVTRRGSFFGRASVVWSQGLMVGVITGLLGAGGGFLILPALVLFSRLPMRKAVGSSLTIIACNCFLGFFSSTSHAEINWTSLLLFTLIAIGGIFIGMRLSDKISGSALKTGFGWFILLIGLCVIVRQLLLV